MISVIRRLALQAVLAAFALVLVACGSGAESPDSAGSSSAVADSETAGTPAAVPEGKLSANNASEAEMAAVFEAAGIPNAEQWAHEVEEYRPYPEDDAEFNKLRDDLAKYNPGPGVIDDIVELLELP